MAAAAALRGGRPVGWFGIASDGFLVDNLPTATAPAFCGRFDQVGHSGTWHMSRQRLLAGTGNSFEIVVELCLIRSVILVEPLQVPLGSLDFSGKLTQLEVREPARAGRFSGGPLGPPALELFLDARYLGLEIVGSVSEFLHLRQIFLNAWVRGNKEP